MSTLFCSNTHPFSYTFDKIPTREFISGVGIYFIDKFIFVLEKVLKIYSELQKVRYSMKKLSPLLWLLLIPCQIILGSAFRLHKQIAPRRRKRALSRQPAAQM